LWYHPPSCPWCPRPVLVHLRARVRHCAAILRGGETFSPVSSFWVRGRINAADYQAHRLWREQPLPAFRQSPLGRPGARSPALRRVGLPVSAPVVRTGRTTRGCRGILARQARKVNNNRPRPLTSRAHRTHQDAGNACSRWPRAGSSSRCERRMRPEPASYHTDPRASGPQADAEHGSVVV
jgi:hypothetical protein